MEKLHTASVDDGNERRSPLDPGAFKTSNAGTGELQQIFHSVL